MFTTCPKCALHLAVTAADLRVGQGYVRCGRCANVFNALIGLSDELPDAEEHSLQPPADDADSQVVDIATGDSLIVQELTEAAPQAAEESDAAAERFDTMLVEEHLDDEEHLDAEQRTGTFETIVLEGDTILQTEEVVDEDIVDEQLEALTQRIDAAHQHAADVHDATELLGAVESADGNDGDDVADLAGNFTADFTRQPAAQDATPRASLLRKAIVAGCAVLSLLLVLQAVHHWRNALAANRTLYGPLSAVYAALGASLEPRWDLQAYQVRRLGDAATATSDRRVSVRATVQNDAAHAQPLPLLRLTLQDIYGNDIGVRDLTPAEYLVHRAGAKAPAQQLLQPNQRVDAQIVVIDPTGKAAGFEFDVCLRSASSVLRCAADEPQAAARR